MAAPLHANKVIPCTCELPERPDNWSDDSWQKYKMIMARLPCKTCGWAGGSDFVMPLTDRFAPKESVCVTAPNLKKPEGKADQQQVTAGATTSESPSTESVVSPSPSVSTSEDFVYTSGSAENDGKETDDTLVIYEM